MRPTLEYEWDLERAANARAGDLEEGRQSAGPCGGRDVTALGMAVRQTIALGARGELLLVEWLGGGPMWLRVRIAAAA